MHRVADPQRGYLLRAALDAVAERGTLAVERLSPLEVVGRPSGVWQAGARVRLHLRTAAFDVGPLEGTVEPQGDLVSVVFDRLVLEEGRAILALLQTLKAAGHVATGGQQTLSGDVVHERISDPRRVAAIVRQIFDRQCDTRIRVAGRHGPALWARPTELIPGSALPLAWEAESPWPDAPFEICATWMNWDFCFRVDRAVAEAGRLHTSLPDEIVRVRNRLLRRVDAPAGSSIFFLHPLWPEVMVRQPLRDLSISGASFATNVVEDGVFPGLELPVVELAWPWGDRARFRASVRHLSPGIRGEAILCGVSLEPITDEDERVWRAATDRLFYPHTTLAPGRAEPMWELFDRSGYFSLSGKSTPEFASLRQAFTRVNARLGQHNDVGCHVVLENGEHAHSSVTMVKPYTHSWFTCQIARRHDKQPDALTERRVLLETMLHGFEYPLRDPGFRWFVSWVQEEARWSRWLLHELAHRYADDAASTCILRFRAMEGRCDAESALQGVGYSVAPATSGEVEQLLAVVDSTRPGPYREAHDLVAERIDLSAVQRRWAELGLRRRREILVARRGGQAVAAGVLDLVEDGVHLFGLLDVVRTFALAPGGEEAFGAILEAAREWYRGEGKQKFAYFVEHEDFSHAQRAGMIDLGGADLVVIASGLMPDQLEHIWEITAPRDTPPLRSRTLEDARDA